MSDFVPPKQSPEKYDAPKHDALNQGAPPRYSAPQGGGGGGGGQIAIGLLLLVGGIGLSVAGTGRVFIGLIAAGVITLIKGIAKSGS
jgi:hypothetical protein